MTLSHYPLSRDYEKLADWMEKHKGESIILIDANRECAGRCCFTDDENYLFDHGGDVVEHGKRKSFIGALECIFLDYIPPIEPRQPSRVEELLRDVMHQHACPESGGYNGCDTDPCQWCEQAKEEIDRMHAPVEDLKPEDVTEEDIDAIELAAGGNPEYWTPRGIAAAVNHFNRKSK